MPCGCCGGLRCRRRKSLKRAFGASEEWMLFVRLSLVSFPNSSFHPRAELVNVPTTVYTTKGTTIQILECRCCIPELKECGDCCTRASKERNRRWIAFWISSSNFPVSCPVGLALLQSFSSTRLRCCCNTDSLFSLPLTLRLTDHNVQPQFLSRSSLQIDLLSKLKSQLAIDDNIDVMRAFEVAGKSFSIGLRVSV